MKKYRSAYIEADKKQFEGDTLVNAIGSTRSVDRDGEIIEPMGIDLKNFLKNPKLLWSHDSYSLPLGKVKNVRIDDQNLYFDADFATKQNPFAKQVRDLMDGGFLNAFSIGFIPLEREGNTITKSELLEISVVNIPANPEALVSREYKQFNDKLETLRKPRDGTLKKENDKQKNYVKKKTPKKKTIIINRTIIKKYVKLIP